MNFRISGQKINIICKTKYLELILDSHLTFKYLENPKPGFYPSTFVNSLYFLLSSLSLNLGLQFAGKCISHIVFDCRNIACTSFV